MVIGYRWLAQRSLEEQPPVDLSGRAIEGEKMIYFEALSQSQRIKEEKSEKKGANHTHADGQRAS